MQSLQKTSKSNQLLLAFEVGHGQIFNRGSGSPLSIKSILGFWVWCQCCPTWWAQVKVVVFTASGFYFSTGGAFGTLGWVDFWANFGIFPILTVLHDFYDRVLEMLETCFCWAKLWKTWLIIQEGCSICCSGFWMMLVASPRLRLVKVVLRLNSLISPKTSELHS